MGRVLKIVLVVIVSTILLYNAFHIVQQFVFWRQAEQGQQNALDIALGTQPPEDDQPTVTLPPEPVQPATEPPTEAPTEAPTQPMDDTTRMLLDMDLEALRATNPDVLGWICIPDTVISYPLMKAKDNDQYLYQTWDKKYSKYGSIFLECRNSHDFSDFNTLVYGHNMLTKDMFGTLSDYKSQDFYQSHPSVYILLDDGVRRYDVFSCYDADVVSNTYRLVFENDARKQESLDLYTSKSLLETDLVPSVTDRILTLSTCTGRGTANLRFVVQAILAQKTERAG
ncbi:MAG: class B sortase [Clostridia bacterium]|nr:class B sortase [Clostridia bacterium]